MSMVQADGTIKQLAAARVGIRDLNDSQSNTAASEKRIKNQLMNSFILNLMKKDRLYYDRLVDLMRYFNQVDVDLKAILKLRKAFDMTYVAFDNNRGLASPNKPHG